MYKYLKLIIWLVIFIFIASPISTAYAKDKKEDEKAKPTGNGKPFEEIIKDYQKIEGLWTLYTKADEGKVYLEIKPEQLGKMYVCNATRSAGDGNFYDSGADAGDFPFKFVRVGKKIQMMLINLRFRADSTAALAKALDRGVSNSIFGVAKIEGEPNKETQAVLVDPSDFFIQDVDNTSYFLGKQGKMEYTFDKENSHFGTIKSFPENTEIDAIYHFKSQKPNDTPNLACPYSMLHTYHFSIFELKDNGYKPRLADDRVGYFQTIYQDYTKLNNADPYVRYINRWNLEKAFPESTLSEPKAPIVFWLENTIPEEYRPYVEEGVLNWNKAFEKAGFRNAVVVKQMPDTATWDPADARYSTIRWIVYPGGTYAVGPSNTNPFTGQIYDADVRICVDFIRWMYYYSEYYVDPVAQGNNDNDYFGGSDYEYRDRVPEEMAKDAAFTYNLLLARNDFENIDSVTQEFVKQYVVDLVCHEVGHTLGLRHNFKSSITHTNQERHDVSITSRDGLTASVMDYNPANIAPPGVRQGEYWNTTPGTYDLWVIEYGYKPIDSATPKDELPELQKIASRSADPMLPYGTDEDVFNNSMQGIDPYCNQRDLSNDPLAFYKDEIALSKELWSKIEAKFEKPGNRYQKLLSAFNSGWRSYYFATALACKFIGGIDRNNYHVGDSPTKLPFTPVPAVKQREAMEFLKKNILAADAFNFSPSLLNKLQPERLDDFEGTSWKINRLDYPIHDRVFNFQKIPIDRLFEPILLQRMQDIQLRYDKGQDIYTMTDMFTDLRRAIWTELTTGQNINSFRRRLQRYHLDKDIDMAINEKSGVPEDARTLARNDLLKLQGGIAAALVNQGLDLITKAHLEECKARIDTALKAGVERGVSASAARMPND